MRQAAPSQVYDVSFCYFWRRDCLTHALCEMSTRFYRVHRILCSAVEEEVISGKGDVL